MHKLKDEDAIGDVLIDTLTTSPRCYSQFGTFSPVGSIPWCDHELP